MKNLIHLFLLAILFYVTSCKKDTGPDNPYGLPAATQTGAGTFGCLINGVPWVAENNRLSGWDTQATYDEIGVGVADNFYFNVSADYFPETSFPPPDSAISDFFLIQITPIYNEGDVDFTLLSDKSISYKTGLINIPNTTRIYNLDTLYKNNTIHISNLDTVSNVISGKFNLQLIRNTNLNVFIDTLSITEGRFDVKYQPD